jgi:hypothetical protein
MSNQRQPSSSRWMTCGRLLRQCGTHLMQPGLAVDARLRSRRRSVPSGWHACAAFPAARSPAARAAARTRAECDHATQPRPLAHDRLHPDSAIHSSRRSGSPMDRRAALCRLTVRHAAHMANPSAATRPRTADGRRSASSSSAIHSRPVPLPPAEGRCGVNDLEGAEAEGTVEDAAFDRTCRREDDHHRCRRASARRRAGRNASRMRLHQQCLGMTVAALLVQISLHGEAAVMPDHGARGQNAAALLAQPPADIHIITGGGELRTETADADRARLADGQIAAGQMLGLRVVQQHVCGCSRSGCHDAFDTIARRRRDVWPAGGHDVDFGSSNAWLRCSSQSGCAMQSSSV